MAYDRNGTVEHVCDDASLRSVRHVWLVEQ